MRSDDRLEYEWWFRVAYPRILRTVSQIVWDRAAAEDVTQEAFLKLLQHWRTASGYEQPDAWVRRVAIRLAVRQAKRELRRRHVERQQVPKSGSGGTPDALSMRAYFASRRSFNPPAATPASPWPRSRAPSTKVCVYGQARLETAVHRLPCHRSLFGATEESSQSR